MIRPDHIRKVFSSGTVNENVALKQVNVRVSNGDFITVIGSNGAAKTTLLNLITVTHTVTSGHIYINDKDVTKEPEFRRARRMGRIFQDPLPGTASNMSVEDNMSVAYKKGFKGLRMSLNQEMRDFFYE